MHKSLKLFGAEGKEAILTEIQQLEQRKVMQPQHANEMTQTQ